MAGKKTIDDLCVEMERVTQEIARLEEEEKRKEYEEKLRKEGERLLEEVKRREHQEKVEKVEKAKCVELAALKKAREAKKAKQREATATQEGDKDNSDLSMPVPTKKLKALEKPVEKSGATTVAKGKKRDWEEEVPMAKCASRNHSRCQWCANLQIDCIYPSGRHQKSCHECVTKHETCYEEGTQRPPKRTCTCGAKQEGLEDRLGLEFDALVETMIDVKEEVQKLEVDLGDMTQIMLDGVTQINNFN
jgi:hypothetical protein